MATAYNNTGHFVSPNLLAGTRVDRFAEQRSESLLTEQDWNSIAAAALAGCAPAQYMVAGRFEQRGDRGRAREWYRRSAAQGHSPAVSKLAELGR